VIAAQATINAIAAPAAGRKIPEIATALHATAPAIGIDRNFPPERLKSVRSSAKV
jgi:hypothetical protein